MSAPAPEAGAAAPERAEPRGTLARNAFHLVLGQVATTVLGVVLSAGLGRALGAVDFGLFFVVTSMSAFAYVLVEWGQGQYVIREVARRPDAAGGLLGTGLALRFAGGLAAAALTALAAGLFGYDARTSRLAGLFIVTTLPFFLAQAFGMVFRGRERMDYDALVTVLNKALTLAITIAALVLGSGLAGAILAQGAAGVGALAAAAALLGRLGIPRLRVTAARARELLVGGSPMVAMSLAISAQGYIDAVVLSRLVPGEEVGWYGAAKTILGTLIAPATILGSASFPRLSRATGDRDRFRAELRAALRPLLGLAALAGVDTYLFADFAVGLIYGGASFAPAAVILRVFAPGLFLLFLDVLLCTGVIADGRAKPLAVAKAVTVIIGTGLDLLLIPVFRARYGNGGIAVVVAFGATELVMFAAALWLLPRRVVERQLVLDILRAAIASVGTLLVFRALPSIPPAVGLPASVAVFLALAVAVRIVRRDDVETLRAMLRRKA